MVEEIYKQFEKKRVEALKQPEFKEKELTPEKEREILKETVSEKITRVQTSQPSQRQAVARNAKQIGGQPEEKQVHLLTELAFDKGIPHAVEVARRLDNPYLLDEFHDALVDELYNKLVETGKLKAL